MSAISSTKEIRNSSRKPGYSRARNDALQQLPLPSANLRRLDGVQMLRAVAVFVVAWFHAGQLNLVLGATQSLPHLGIAGVDLFFVISGFILCLLPLRARNQTPGVQTARQFLLRRIARIFPVYWIFAAPAIIHHVHHGLVDSSPYIPPLFLLPSYSYPSLLLLANFSWTLIFEMFFYLMMSCILLFTARRAPVALAGALTLFVAAGAIVGTQRPFLMVFCNPIILEFAFGAVVAMIYYEFESWASRAAGRRTGWALICFGSAAAITLSAVNPQWIAPYQNQILAGDHVLPRALTWGLASAVVLTGVLFVSPALTSRTGRLLIALGNASYSTYLLSGLAFIYLSVLCGHLRRWYTVNSLEAVAAIQIGVVAALMAVGVLFYRFVERPLIRYAYHLLARNDN